MLIYIRIESIQLLTKWTSLGGGARAVDFSSSDSLGGAGETGRQTPKTPSPMMTTMRPKAATTIVRKK